MSVYLLTPCLNTKHLFFSLCCFFCASQERESLNANIVDAINQASDCWGIRCLRYEIKDIHVPPRVKESMQMQVRFCGSAVWDRSKVSPSTPHHCCLSGAGSVGPSCGEGSLLALWLQTYSYCINNYCPYFGYGGPCLLHGSPVSAL